MGFFSKNDKDYCDMGINQFKKGNYSKSIEYYDKALKQNPDNADAWTGKGASLDLLRDRSGSMKCLDKALNINPKHFSALFNQGKVRFKVHEFNESLKYYDKVLEINPNHIESLLDKANIMILVTRFNEAIDCINRIQQLDVTTIKENIRTKLIYSYFLNRLRNDKAIAFAGLGKYDKSLRCYDKALQIHPNDTRSLNNKKITQIEKLLSDNGDSIYIDKFAKKYSKAYGTFEGYRFAEEYIHDNYAEGYIPVYSPWYVTDTINIEFQRFLELLQSKGYKLNEKLLTSIIRNSIEIQAYLSFKQKILYNSPENINDFIDNFLEIYDNNWLNIRIQYLKKLIKEQGHVFVEINIDNSINNRRKELELANFERSLLDDEDSISIDEIDGLSGYDFELFTKILFENMGFESYNTKLSGDQGADLVLKKFGEITVVQAKRYNNKVTNTAIQEVVASIKHYNAHKGVVITNNEFTDSAIDLAYSNDVELIDRTKLIELIDKHPVNKTHLEKNI